MPIYEYECAKCGEFEVNQRITDDPLKRCPKCKGKVRKLISNTSFQLKGSGWYVTDYARSGSSKKESESTPADTSSSSDTKSETKSESTASDSSKSDSSKTESKSDKKSKKSSAKAA
jgi:putative FmdB family regulatory protein